MVSTLFTVGFTQKTAEQFFRLLQDAGVQRIIDIRENRVGQPLGVRKISGHRLLPRPPVGNRYVLTTTLGSESGNPPGLQDDARLATIRGLLPRSNGTTKHSGEVLERRFGVDDPLGEKIVLGWTEMNVYFQPPECQKTNSGQKELSNNRFTKFARVGTSLESRHRDKC